MTPQEQRAQLARCLDIHQLGAAYLAAYHPLTQEETHTMDTLKEINRILHNPAASFWLKDALRTALDRDPVDAQFDAHLLSRLLREHYSDVRATYMSDNR